MLTLITPTRNRPQCFSILEKYISRQTYNRQFQWVVVCDGGFEEYKFTLGQEVYKRDTGKDEPGKHSICYNYLYALDKVKGDKVLCVEDDDWYSPGYLSVMNKHLNKYPLVGSIPAKYYNLFHRQYRVFNNTNHASLAQTGFTSEAVPMFRHFCEFGKDPFLDMLLWGHWQTEQKKFLLFPNDGLHYGLKGLWGEPGCGSGHSPRMGASDWSLEVLREWIEDDITNYVDD